MAFISKYQKNDYGSYDVVVRGVHLKDNDKFLLDGGYKVNVDVKIEDSNLITVQQRKKIFALLNDIYDYTGQPQEDLRQTFQSYLQIMHDYKEISLSDCSKKIAGELIELILAWIFMHNIPLSYKTSDLMKEDNNFLYHATVNRKCVICGKTDSDLAHLNTVGAGRNRNEINHYGNKVLALCRAHHSEQHRIGIKSFNDKYHLHDSWIDVDEKLNKMLRGERSD